MNSLRPLLEKIASARKGLVLSLYFDPRFFVGKPVEMQTAQRRFREQMGSYQHSGVTQRRVNPTETQRVLNSPTQIRPVLDDVSRGYCGMVYDVFLVDESRKPTGRSWELYDLMCSVGGIAGLVDFYREAVLSSATPKELRPELLQAVKQLGTAELRRSGQSKKVAKWEAIFSGNT